MTHLSPLTLDRVKAVMKRHNVTLADATNFPDVAGANLNGTDVTFAIVADELIVRSDIDTGMKTADRDPLWFMAANTFNTVAPVAKATIMDRTEELILRTEVETDCAAGVTDEQLDAIVSRAVNAVLEAGPIIRNIVREISSHTDGSTPE